MQLCGLLHARGIAWASDASQQVWYQGFNHPPPLLRLTISPYEANLLSMVVCSRGGVWSLHAVSAGLFEGRCMQVTVGSAGVCSRGGAWSLQVLLVSVRGEVRGHCRFCWCRFEGRCVVTAGSAGVGSRGGAWSLQVLPVSVRGEVRGHCWFCWCSKSLLSKCPYSVCLNMGQVGDNLMNFTYQVLHTVTLLELLPSSSGRVSFQLRKLNVHYILATSFSIQ